MCCHNKYIIRKLDEAIRSCVPINHDCQRPYNPGQFYGSAVIIDLLLLFVKYSGLFGSNNILLKSTNDKKRIQNTLFTHKKKVIH